MSTPICLIVNPSAGGGKAGRVLADVLAALEGHGLQVRSELTRDLAHARELAREACLAGETVVCLSGDGMVGAVADVLREFPDALLGVLPGGRGNDLARVLGIPADPVEACAIVAAGFSRKLDLGEVDSIRGHPKGHPKAYPRGTRRRQAGKRSWGSRASASTAMPTASPTRLLLGLVGSCTPMGRCVRFCSGARRAFR